MLVFDTEEDLEGFLTELSAGQRRESMRIFCNAWTAAETSNQNPPGQDTAPIHFVILIWEEAVKPLFIVFENKFAPRSRLQG